MPHAFHLRPAAALAALALAFLPAIAPARADINGFGDPAGFTFNTANAPGPLFVGNALQITTDGNIGQSNSAFCDSQQDIETFTASFTYQEQYNPATDSGLSPADGAAFVIQNDPNGVDALGTGGSDLGYSGGPNIVNSVAVTFNIWSGHIVGTNLISGGNSAYVYQNTSPVNLASGHPIAVSLAYNGAVLSELLVDTMTGATYTTSYKVNIPSLVGGTSANIGFTGGTGSGESTQTISNFVFTSGTPSAQLTFAPNPALGGKTVIGTLMLASAVKKLTSIPLSSSDPVNAAVPATVQMPKGHLSVKFTITTQDVAAPEDVTVAAQAPGGTVYGGFSLKSPVLISQSIVLNANPLVGGNYTFASATVSSPAPAGGLTVGLSVKNNPYSAVTGFWSAPQDVPGSTQIFSVTIPQGATSASFVIYTNLVPKAVNVPIQGSLNGVVRTSTLSVIPPVAD